jgi:hypothetical protein
LERGYKFGFTWKEDINLDLLGKRI